MKRISEKLPDLIFHFLINRVVGETDPVRLKGWLRQAAKAKCVEDLEVFPIESKKTEK